MRVINNLLGVLFLCGCSCSPYVLDNAKNETPINLLIEKKEAQTNERFFANETIYMPLWSCYDFNTTDMFQASFKIDNISVNGYFSSDFNTFFLDTIYYDVSLEIISYEWTTDIAKDVTQEYYKKYSDFIDVQQAIPAANNLISFNTTLELITNNEIGNQLPLPDYRLTFKANTNDTTLYETNTGSFIYLLNDFITWIDTNSVYISQLTQIDNIYAGYILEYIDNTTIFNLNNYNAAYYRGYAAGYNAANSGQALENAEAYTNGFNAGYSDGENDGYNRGYAAGYNQAMEDDAGFNFSWLTTLFESLNVIFSVEIYPNLKLWYLVAGPLIVALIVGVFKLLR